MIDSLNMMKPTKKSVNDSTPAMTTRTLPRGWLDEILWIQNRFPKKNNIPAASEYMNGFVENSNG